MSPSPLWGGVGVNGFEQLPCLNAGRPGGIRRHDARRRFAAMPTLTRFLVRVAILAGLAYGAMYALVLTVEPHRGKVSVEIPPERLQTDDDPGALELR